MPLSKVGEVDLWEYLIARSGLLVEAEGLESTTAGTNSIHFTTANGSRGYGTATAIDQRGYFLTAAHCVRKGQSGWPFHEMANHSWSARGLFGAVKKKSES